MNAILIPAYKPDEKLVGLCELLLGHEEIEVVVVDDGSGEAYKGVFGALDKRVHLISYPVNKGKGGALKTGIEYIYNNLPSCERLVTADADGQHRYEDIQKVIAKSVECPKALILGSRRFDEENVPFRSRFGNGMTRAVFRLVSGAKVYDTQTGLRAFDRELMKRFMAVKGERYEYEMNMLLEAAKHKIPILEVTIKTVYLNENESSHFNPLKDSAKIYYCLLKYFIKFLASSLFAFCVEYVIVLLLNHFFVLKGVFGLKTANTLARIVSATVNFTVNHTLVFEANEKWWKALIKYAALALVILVLDNYLLEFFHDVAGIKLGLAKPITEIIMFCINFPIQKRFVYTRQKLPTKKH